MNMPPLSYFAMLLYHLSRLICLEILFWIVIVINIVNMQLFLMVLPEL